MLLLIPEWLTLFNGVMLAIGFLCVAGVSILLFLSKRKDEILITEKQRADTNAGLVVSRDNQIKDLEKLNKLLEEKNAKLEDEIEEVTSEYRSLVAIDIQKLLEYWQTREFELALMVRQKSELRILKTATGLGENDDIIHKTS